MGDCQNLAGDGVVIDGKAAGTFKSNFGCHPTSTPGTGCWVNKHGEVRSTTDGCSQATGKSTHFPVCKAVPTQADADGCLVRHDSTSHQWIVHNDGTRNWIPTPTSGCNAKALKVPDVTVYTKRHGGSGAYALDAAQSAKACGNSACEGDADGCLVRESSTSHQWIVHNDGTRNWIPTPTSGCNAKALMVPDVAVFTKRHGGSGDYTLDSAQSSKACGNSACKAR